MILYQPRITQEPSIISKKPTIKPSKAGLKSIAIPNTRQKVQKSTINGGGGNEAYFSGKQSREGNNFFNKKAKDTLGF